MNEDLIAAVAPLLDVLIQAVAAVLLAVAVWALQRLTSWLGLANDDRVRAYLQDALNRAVDFGVAEARSRIPLAAAAGARRQVADLAMTLAADWAQDRVPDALRHFRIGDEGLRGLLAARLPDELATAQRDPASAVGPV